LAYSLLAAIGIATGILRAELVPLCLALLCFATGLWFTNAFLEHRGQPLAWGLVTNAAGWGAVSLAFLVPRGWHLPFFLLAAGLIAAGGVAAWLAGREENGRARPR